MSAPTVLDLFCGAAGGWSLGLHRAGFRTVAACEIDPARRAVFAVNNPGVRIYDDVRSLSAARLLGDLGFLPDVVVGSPPCQDASTANTKGRGVDGDRTGLFFDAIRLVGEIRPRWCALENVAGLLDRGIGRVLDALEGQGYSGEVFRLGAHHFGAPHLRGRTLIVSHRVDADEEGEPWCPLHEAVGGMVGTRPWAAGWSEGGATFRRVADGVPARVAIQCLEAYGDAVLPQITEAVGRSILFADRVMREVRP
jgi:site-specific DNA-cytosine methylase